MNQEILSIRRDSAELGEILFEGRVLRHGEPWVAVPREVVLNPQGVESVIFEATKPADLQRPGTVRAWAEAARVGSLTVTAMPLLTVLELGWFRGWVADWAMGVLSLLGVFFFHIAINLLNDVQDHRRLIDLPGSVSGSGVLHRGWFSARELRDAAYLALGLGVLCGLLPVIRHPGILAWVGLVAGVGVLGYSGRPFSLKYRAWGELGVFVLSGPLLVLGYSVAVFGQWDFALLLLGVVLGLLAWTILHAHHLSQAARGGTSLASRVGFRWARRLLVGAYCAIYLILVLGWLRLSLPMTLAVLPCTQLPRVLKLLRSVMQASGPASALLGSVRTQAAYIHFGFSVWIPVAFALLKY